MAYTHSRYKNRDAVPLDVEINTPKADIAGDAVAEQMMPAMENHDFTPKAEHNDASVAFHGQLDALRAAEARQPRQQAEAAQKDLQKAFDAGDVAAQADATNRIAKANTLLAAEEDRLQRIAQGTPTLPPTRALRLQHWLDQGLSPSEADYFNALHENPTRTHNAVMATHQMGIDPNDPIFHNEVQRHFRQMEAADTAAHPPPTPASVPLPLKRGGIVDEDDYLDRGRDRVIVSAPVSRETMGTMGGSYNGDRPGRITLSVAQKEAARFSGISEREYAEQLLRLRAEKAEGSHGGSP